MRLLVITNETAEGAVLHDAIRSLARAPGAEVLVVAPALNSRLRHWMSDADPMQAIADALAMFPADELLLATHPRDRSHWLERDLVSRACVRFGLPVAHVVVDLERRLELLVA